jgi:hyaluronan synthase
MQVSTIADPKTRRLSINQRVARGLIVAALGTIVSIKIYLVLFVLDPLVGVYGLITTSLVFTAFLFTFTRYKDPSLKINAKNKTFAATPFVSVIIPAKNDPIIIRKSVEAILSSTYQKVEVICVNDGSTDNTGKVMDDLHREHPDRVKVIQLLRNIGKRGAIKEAMINGSPRGDIIVLIDSDSAVHKDAIERLVRAFDDPDVGAATGTARALNADENMLTKMQDAWYDGQFYVMKGMESSLNSVTCCSGSLSAYRREAIMPCLEMWCADTFLGVEFRPGDDRHLTSYVLGGNKHYIDSSLKKWKVVYCENAVVHTEVPSKFKKFVNQQIRWKKSWVRVFLFNAPFFYKDRSPVSWLYYYTQMSLSIISPLIALRALVLLPLQHHFTDSIFYLSGLFFIGMMYAATYKLRNPKSGNRWLYRLLVMLLSIPLGFLLYYSLLTIKKTSWLTR